MADGDSGGILRVYGPPGTGKTTFLAERVRKTVAKHGPDSILLSSFSTTAAQEMASRFTRDGAGARPLAAMIGTLHSHAFHSGSVTNVALDPRVVEDWNASVEPELHITPDTRRSGGRSGDTGSLSVDPQSARTGDELIGVLDRLRAACVDPEDWPPNVQAFHARWTAWKADANAIDYTDMIDGALAMARDGVPAPGRPRFIVVDEAQDMTPLEIRLALCWGSMTDLLVLGMDDDQAINRWRGGNPEPLLALEGAHVTDRVLDRSYRVPEAVRALAEAWVRRLSRRREKVYQSRLDEHGQVVPGIAHHVPESLHSPGLVDKITAETDQGHTVMIIASCNYMLAKLIEHLRVAGVPFHNPYRPAEQAWNPLGPPSREDAMSTAERVRRFLALSERDWTGEDIAAWAALIKLSDAGMVRGAKTAISHFPGRDTVPFEDVAALFRDDAIGRAALDLASEPDLGFLEGALLKAKVEPARYPIQIARSHGAAALDEVPKVVVGTIHSVKGATADIVYVAPDISNAARLNLGHQDGRDESIRLFYVALTRAYRELRVLTPSPRSPHIRPAELLPPELEVMRS